MQNRYQNLFPATLAFSAGLMLLGFTLEAPMDILEGLYHIVTMQDLLITDYVSIGGVGAALVNSGLVMVLSICLIKLSKDPFNGFTMVEMGLMAGFSLFGKNILNIWPIILGTWLYARYQKEPFSKHASVALLATSLAPLVSYMSLGSIHASLPLGIFSGVVIGFILPSLSAYTYKVQNGMNLYNMGFACGLFAMMIVPILTAFGDHPDSAMYWATEYNSTFAIILGVICAVFIFTGFFGSGMPFWAVWAGYRRLLSTTGRAPSDYLRMFGAGPVLVNTGVNGLIGMAYIFIVGGQLNGPTLGGSLPSWASPPLESTPGMLFPSWWELPWGPTECTTPRTIRPSSWRVSLAPPWLPSPAISAGPSAFWPGSFTRPWCSRPAAPWRG